MAFNMPSPRPNENYISYIRRLMPELTFAMNSLATDNENLKTENERLAKTISQLTDTGWRKINSNISYRCKNGLVTVVGDSADTALAQNEYKVVGTIPAIYQPSVKMPLVYSGVGGVMDGQSGYIHTNGDISLYTTESGKTHWAFSITYSIK